MVYAESLITHDNIFNRRSRRKKFNKFINSIADSLYVQHNYSLTIQNYGNTKQNLVYVI